MSVRDRPCTRDGRLREVFGAPVADLYETAIGPDAPAVLARALELRSFLALTEEQVTHIRDRIYASMSPERDMDDLSADRLRMDTQWLQAALDARDNYTTALDTLLRTLPAPGAQARPVPVTRRQVATTLPPGGPAPPGRGRPPPPPGKAPAQLRVYITKITAHQT
ncbi:hypothetical protein, partial [Streptomyces sp. NPDC056987]|uniref:hypothetical protein n=1 Tax=Streptomyces sp. NPDC056987 TaxID=3345988 RepID=UPI0036456B13